MLPVYLFAAGALGVVLEPYTNVLGLAAYPEIGQATWLRSLGRDIPVYVGLIYLFYWAPMWLLLVDWFAAGIRVRTYWMLCGALVIGALVVDVIAIHYRLWVFYGQQPLRVGGMPVWWAFANSHALIASTVALSLLLKVLPRGRQFLLVGLMPAIMVAAHTGGSVAATCTVGSTNDRTVTLLGTSATVVLILGLLWVYSLVVCRPPMAATQGGVRGDRLDTDDAREPLVRADA
ncbi:MAG: hypothetical protein JWO02_1606 [Solirubrobacterales bacterium]|nr:hypothetical protein [Solirubrobacterales bacterium]